MLLVDDLLLTPFTSLLWVFKELHKVVQQEVAGEADAVTRELSELYMQLETGGITEEEFATQEARLLDQLEAIQRREDEDNGELEDEDDEESEGEDDGELEDEDDEESEDEDDEESEDEFDEDDGEMEEGEQGEPGGKADTRG